MNAQVKGKAPFILVVAVAFFVYQLLLLANSFEAEYRLIQNLYAPAISGNLFALRWLSCELIGEVGVIIRFIGACIFVAFAALLLLKKTFSVSLLRKSVLLEGIYYLFNMPFIIHLLTGPVSNATLGAALSYAGQLLLVTPIFLKLYWTLRKPSFEPLQAARWIALAIAGFTFALWVKHFALALYALPAFSLNDAVLMVGFVNSTVTLLAAGFLMVAAFMPLIKKQGLFFKGKWFGAALVLMGLYVIIFLIVSALSPAYWTWISLVDWWIIVMPILGVRLLIEK
ncbi:MAG: hypothetical protein ACQCN5_01470 [Candidatus Bathyarchaeia archaeon]|jgi:hypothetical protein